MLYNKNDCGNEGWNFFCKRRKIPPPPPPPAAFCCARPLPPAAAAAAATATATATAATTGPPTDDADESHHTDGSTPRAPGTTEPASTAVATSSIDPTRTEDPQDHP